MPIRGAQHRADDRVELGAATCRDVARRRRRRLGCDLVDDRPLCRGAEPDPVRSRHLACLRDCRLETRTPVRVAPQLADRPARGRARRGEWGDPAELVPEDALLALPDPDVESRLTQDLRRRLDLARVRLSDAMVMTGAPVASMICTLPAR